jgi:hypothetical protein
MLRIVGLKEIRHLWREEPLPDAVIAENHRDFDSLLCKHRADFHTDKAASDHNRTLYFFQCAPNDFGVTQRSEVTDILKVRAGNVQLSRASTRGDNELVKTELAARLQIQPLACEIYG